MTKEKKNSDAGAVQTVASAIVYPIVVLRWYQAPNPFFVGNITPTRNSATTDIAARKSGGGGGVDDHILQSQKIPELIIPVTRIIKTQSNGVARFSNFTWFVSTNAPCLADNESEKNLHKKWLFVNF